MAKHMDKSRTKLAVRATVVGYRAVKATADQVGGPRGDKIAANAKTRAVEILDDIDEHGTNAKDERQAARREVGGGSS